MQQQIEEEITDEIALAEEQYQHEKEAHSLIARKRKLQDTRKVNFDFVFVNCLYRYDFF